jgi:hypothetical protein
MGPDPPEGGGVRCCHVWEPGPYGPKHLGQPRGPDLPSPGKEVRCRHVPLRKQQLGELCHTSGGRWPSVGCQPNNRIKCE